MKTISGSIATLSMIGVLLYGLCGPAKVLAGETNIDSFYKYAWSETSGWVNFRPSQGGVMVHDTYLSGYAWAENIGWIHFKHTGANAYEVMITNYYYLPIIFKN